MKVIIFFISLLTFTFYSVNLQSQSRKDTSKSELAISKETKKNALKVSLLSPLLEHLEISYERVLHPQGNLEFSLGRIGFGNFKHETLTIEDQRLGSRKIPVVKKGLFFRAGYKHFFHHPVSKRSGVSTSFFNGLYLQPELTIGSYEKNDFEKIVEVNSGLVSDYTISEKKINYQALLLKIGWQRVLSKHFLIDCSFGVGVGNDNVTKSSSDKFLYAGEFHRGIYKTNGGTTLATNGAIKLGYAF